MSDQDDILLKAAEMLSSPVPRLDEKALSDYVCSFQVQSDVFLRTCRQHGSPLYLFDEQALLSHARQFVAAFTQIFSNFRVFYAVKSNNHELLVKSLVNFGLGLDVSSGMELELALRCGCQDIIFSGPGKTDTELSLAVENYSKVTVLMDSFGELFRLEQCCRRQKHRVRAGIRLTTEERGLWRKFGIPLSTLENFMAMARKCSHVNLSGLQFHTSWNLDPTAQIEFLVRLGRTLRQLPQTHLSAIAFIDIGGGFWPSRGEWLQSAGTPCGRLRQAVLAGVQPSAEHYQLPAQSIETFARQIGAAMSTHIFPALNCSVHAEPGRWLCDDAMHILLTVIDKKAADLVITDAGTNLIGWERFETDYAPIINLSRPSRREHKCFVLGSLCTPHDVWGYSYFGDDIQPGDVLLIPAQGAYTFSLRQKFIKPLAKVVPLQDSPSAES
jgi:diaminopimelate decarboxylase